MDKGAELRRRNERADTPTIAVYLTLAVDIRLPRAFGAKSDAEINHHRHVQDWLLARMDGDQYGHLCRLDLDVAAVFDKVGRAAFIAAIWERFEAEPATDYGRRRWAEMLRTLYVAGKDVAAYIELAEQTEVTVADCLAVAKMLNAKRKPWARLIRLRRSSCCFTSSRCRGWRSSSGAAPTRRSKVMSHLMAETAATKLEKHHGDQAARIWWAQASRILRARKSKQYGAALAHLERAKRCYEKAGLHLRWQEVVAEVYTEHGGLRSFLPGFEALLGGSGPSDEPSFLDRAKQRWSARHSDQQ